MSEINNDKRFDLEWDSDLPKSNHPDAETNDPQRKIFVVNGLKQCIDCKQWLKLDQFHKATKLAYGLTKYCKECNKRRRLEHYYKSKEESPYRDEEGNTTLPHKPFKKKWKMPKRGKKRKYGDAYHKHVWLFELNGCALYDRMWPREDKAREYLAEQIALHEDGAVNAKGKRAQAKHRKELEYYKSLVIARYFIRKMRDYKPRLKNEEESQNEEAV